jgi:uncharacterized protein YegP (UPF0339 family)
MAAKYHLKKASDGQFLFNLHASNGDIVLTSERYKAKTSAVDGIESVRRNAQREGAFEIKIASNGKHYFVLNATNGQVVGQSQMYASKATADAGVAAVKRYAADAPISDDT